MHIIVKKEIQVILSLTVFYDAIKRCPNSRFQFFKHILAGQKHHSDDIMLLQQY